MKRRLLQESVKGNTNSYRLSSYSMYRNLLEFIAVMILLGLVVIGLEYATGQIGWLDPISFGDGVLLVTAAVVAVYTIETMRLRKTSQQQVAETQRQYISSIRPYLRLQWSTDHGLIIKNQGKAVAVDLQFSSDEVAEVDISSVPAIGVDGQATGLIPGGRGQFDFLDPYKRKYNLRVDYENAEGKKYFAIYQSDVSYNDRFKILEQKEG